MVKSYCREVIDDHVSICCGMENDMELREVYDIWKKCKNVSVFGLGHICKNSIEEVQKFSKINYILDNDPKLEGEEFKGIVVRHFSGKKEYLQEKILVSVHYKEIKQDLENLGLQEDRDFCAIEKYITMMEWYACTSLYLNEVHMSVTTKCSLNCQKCNMFMPYYKQPFHIELDALKMDVDTLFEKVDIVSTFALLGGEPLLYPYMVELIEYISEKYSEKIGTIEIITNGTIIPNEKILVKLKSNNIFFRISDYSRAIHYEDKLMQLREVLEKHEISYYINSSLNWLDFGFPEKSICLEDEAVYQHMLDCAPAFKGLNDQKLYYCHIVWSADKCGIYKEKLSDYIDLKKESREYIFSYLMGIMEKPVSLCKYCAGCSSDNQNVIPVGLQQKRRKEIVENHGYCM